ncbi:efflux RND transporter periplasmic adaptor subunit [Treponema zuelzerae]|uniref:Efflux RND transporter periplasmic adaptor subunit n=1 Tax=Teretinema zuelzerae TaxID=156 RepID=A0AAE3JKU7_9SPIR|nr:efflux RND transporter periplasmic adaptor subunit [Teretinema zuelzerae]MCD1654254.1 efflux RND transporter periplasmic adaptor subunit [Teretinema zuelzerae]
MRKQTVLTAAGAAVLLAGGLFVSCGPKKEEAETDSKTETTADEAVFAVTTIPATKGELHEYLQFSGDVTAKTSLDILPDAAGKIVEVKVKVGDRVEKNSIVALVDASRPGMTYEPGPVKSPISGTITAVNVVPGNMVSQQMSVAKVSKTETLQVTMNVPERFVSKIRAEQKAWLRFDAYPGEVFPARIEEISPVLDQTSRTMAVKLALTDPDPRIKAGMFARVKLITDTRTNIVKIPDSAVITRFGETFVFVAVPGESAETEKEVFTVRKQPVKAGIRVDDKIEILSGLTAQDEVVVRGQTLLEDGSKVNVVARLEALPAMESAE